MKIISRMRTLTPEQIAGRVVDILAVYESNDNENAHVQEDDLIEEVIRQLAQRSPLAAALVPLLDRERYRWYA